ncbi:vacuolar protein sorting-associated protein 32 homolog 2-like [Carex rostrata]
MFSKLFRSCKGESISSSDQLKQALETLEKKEIVLQKKISIEAERAKEFTKSRNKEAVMQCIKRKKYYEGQLGQLGSFQMRIHDQEKKQTLVKMASSKNS